jgi:hypothetical protein
VPVGTGFTLGVGTSQTVGWLWRAPDMPQPYWERRGRRPISPWARPPRR